MFVQCLCDRVAEVVRCIISHVNDMSRTHNCRDGTLRSTQERYGRCCPLVASFFGQLGQQRLRNIEENQIVELAHLVPHPLLGGIG